MLMKVRYKIRLMKWKNKLILINNVKFEKYK